MPLLLVGKGLHEHKALQFISRLRKAPCLMLETSEVDCSVSTPLDSSIAVSVVFYSSYNCCVAPGKGLSSSSSELHAALVVQPLMLHWWFSLASPQ